MAAWAPSSRQLCKTIITRPKSKPHFWATEKPGKSQQFSRRRPPQKPIPPPHYSRRAHSNLSLSNLLPSRVQRTHTQHIAILSSGLMTGHDTIGTPCKCQQFVPGAKGKAKRARQPLFVHVCVFALLCARCWAKNERTKGVCASA